MVRRLTALLVIESLLLSLAPVHIPAEPAAAPAAEPACRPWKASLDLRPGQAGVLELDGLRLDLPAGAVKQATTITVTMIPSVNRLAEGLANATAGTTGWRFEPHGTRFGRSVTVTMPFDPSLLSSETALSNLFTYFYDQNAGRWERLQRLAIDRGAATITSVTDHFTDMIAATLRLPEGPAPISFDANAIQRLDAARPDAGVPAPEGLAPGPYGAAAFRIPLRLPPGRGAASPTLAISYSSDAGSTWLGRGFDVEVPRVTIDTRFGLPRYDGTDTCLLSGEELVFAGREGDAYLYRARTERGFERILWHRGGGENRWEVTDKAGVTREYGGAEAWLGPERSDRSRTFTWLISRTRDPFGNTVAFDYQHDASNRYTYLSAVSYAGFESGTAREQGAYRVAFVLEAGDRPDRRVDGRGGFASRLVGRLGRIELRYRGALVRAWAFRYRASETGQSLLASFAEEDGAGATFYTYAFDYHALPERRDEGGALLGYDAFGEREVQWAAEQGDRFRSLHEGVTTGVGASLYTGVRLFLPVPFFRKKTIAHFGVRAGVGFSQGMTRATLMDANGDGLLDAVWREGSSLSGYLNTGTGFDLSQPFRLAGLNEKMDLERQSTFSLGASAGLLGASGGITRHRSWSEAETGFVDIDGDGFVDFVEQGQGTFARHDGSSRFVETPWSMASSAASGGPDPEADDYARSYYLQQPLRRWKAYRSGTVEVAQRVALAGEGSADGARAHTHFRGSTETLAVSPAAPDASGSRSCDVAAGESLYFRLDTGDAELGDDVDWNVSIRYRALRLFEPFAQGALFRPPPASEGALPFGDARLAPIYTLADGSSYTLVASWQERDPSSLSGVYDALIERCLFVPRQVPEPLFRRLASASRAETVVVADPNDPAATVAVAGDLLLMHAFAYVPELALFERASAIADALLMRSLDALTVGERRSLALARSLDGTLVPLQGTGSASRLSVTAPRLDMPARLLDRGILVDQVYDEEGRTRETLWLREDEGRWRLWREDSSGISEAAATLTVAAPGGVTITFADRGVERTCALTGWTSLLAEIAESAYVGPLSEAVMGSETISPSGVETLVQAVYDALYAGASVAERDLLVACYTRDGELWRLVESVSGEDWARLLVFVDARAEQSESLFDVLPGDPQGAMRIVLLDVGEQAALAEVSPEVMPLLEGGAVRRDLTADERALLYARLFSYRRDAEKFPFYRQDAEAAVRRLRDRLSEAELVAAAGAIAAAGLGAWTRLDRQIVYRQTALLPVSDAVLPDGAVEEPLAAVGDRTGSPGDPVGLLLVPAFDAASGRTTLRSVYVHSFDSLRDYTDSDLVDYPADLFADEEQEMPEGIAGDERPFEVFRGGARGWFYGLWSGYHAWDPARLYLTPAAPALGEVTPPPYFAPMSPNRDAGGAVEIAVDGDPPAPVPAEAWIGEVSAWSDTSLDDDGVAHPRRLTFAAWIAGDRLHPSRNGGDAYHRVPRDEDATKPGTLAWLRRGRARSRDVNGSVSLGVLGADFSRNTGSSLQYRALLDLNGDRFPDLLSCPDDGGAFAIRTGTSEGFAPATPWPGASGGIASHDNDAFGFGASVGSTAGGLTVEYDGRGEPVRFLVAQPAAGAGIGANGSLGASVQTAGLLDCNGDGLPDLVRRDSGSFSVSLNTGSGFAVATSWGDAIDVEVLAHVGDLAGQARGISHASAGSFGASVGVSAGGWSLSAGVSAGFTGTVNQTYLSLADINGDGLPDQVAKRTEDPFFLVRFNLGDRFADETVRLYRPEWDVDLRDILRDRVGGDLARIEGALDGLDLPGGFSLPDFVSLPLGDRNPFGSEMDPFAITDVVEYSSGAAFSVGANVTLSLRFWLIALEITPGVGGSYATTSATMRLADIDGDGLPDHVLKVPGDEYLRVKLNAAGKSGLLRTVMLPQGGTIALDYARAGNTVAMPHNRWVLSSVARDDGLAAVAPDRGEHRVVERYAYGDGYYDRAERLFYGFGRVETALGDGSRRVTRYANRNLHTRGMAIETRVHDDGGALVAERTSHVVERSEGWFGGREVVFPAVAEQARRLYEAGTSRCVETRRTLSYDDYGNVSRIEESGDPAVAGDELVADISYAALGGWLRSHPESLRVVDAAGRLLRRRRGSYGDRGELLAVERWRSEGESATWRIGYDPYGNLARLTDPRGYSLEWSYDDQARAFVRSIVSSNTLLGGPSYESRQEWDYGLGVQTARVDAAGNRSAMRHDTFGRLVEVRSPYDAGTAAAVAHEYRTGTFPWVALTRNKLRFDPADTAALATVVTVDGLGRVAQTAKEAEVWDAGSTRAGWVCSGAIVYDAAGRAVAEGQPVFAAGEPLPGLAAVTRPTLRAFDALDRVVSLEAPDGARWTTAYLVPAARAVEVATDPLGRVTERDFDGRGRLVALRRLAAAGAAAAPLPATPADLAVSVTGAAVLTGAAYAYNALGEMLEVKDFAGNGVVRSGYDLLGQRVRLESPDAGVVDLVYDDAGNVARRTDSALRARGEAISYRYDGHNRLVEIDYPRTGDTRYVYGEPGALYNGAGRMVERSDESGAVSYQYGQLGETIATSRRLERLTPLAADAEASLGYLYDYLGRLEQITYPDGEVVTYGYDRGGQVASVTGLHGGWATAYVQRIGYDELGQRVYMRYGNGVESRYTYDPERRWLEAIATAGPWGQMHQDVDYRFDEVGNILEVSNDAAAHSTRQAYVYDDLDQLVQARGTTTALPHGVPEYTSTYDQDFAFDAIANLTRKASSVRTVPVQPVGAGLGYDLDYAYYAGAPHRAERVGGLWYRYDANGNVAEEREGGHGSGPLGDATVTREGDVRIVDRGFGLTRGDASDSGVYERRFAWDEENRLKSVVESDRTVLFRYGADGQRCVKYSADGETLYFDPLWQASTDYPDLRRSKHIYVAGSRVATRLNLEGHSDLGYEQVNTYYYHSDHLGSASLVSDYRGEAYERIEYTPYGEMWVEEKSDSFDRIPFRFTAKEWDEETQLYYYGARYLDPRTSRWASADPALGSYLPGAGGGAAGLPGMGGVFAPVNLSLYHYGANNPLRYFDPTGLSDEDGLPARATISAASAEDFRKPWYSRIPLVSDFLRGGYFFFTGTAGGEEGVTDPLSGDVMFPGEAQDAARGFFFAVAGAGMGVLAKAGTAAASYVDDAAAVAGGDKVVVIGEGMGRIKEAARALRAKGVNAKWYQAWSKNFSSGRPMTPAELQAALERNARWITSKVEKGYKIFDIGQDVTRAVRSPFYALEKSILQALGHPVTPF